MSGNYKSQTNKSVTEPFGNVCLVFVQASHHYEDERKRNEYTKTRTNWNQKEKNTVSVLDLFFYSLHVMSSRYEENESASGVDMGGNV